MTGQGKSAIDTLLAESFKELAKKHPIEKITIIFRISMNC